MQDDRPTGKWASFCERHHGLLGCQGLSHPHKTGRCATQPHSNSLTRPWLRCNPAPGVAVFQIVLFQPGSGTKSGRKQTGVYVYGMFVANTSPWSRSDRAGLEPVAEDSRDIGHLHFLTSAHLTGLADLWLQLSMIRDSAIGGEAPPGMIPCHLNPNSCFFLGKNRGNDSKTSDGHPQFLQHCIKRHEKLQHLVLRPIVILRLWSQQPT